MKVIVALLALTAATLACTLSGTPLLHRVITMTYEAGRRDAARQFTGAPTGAAFMCGFDLAEGGELMARSTEGLLT